MFRGVGLHLTRAAPCGGAGMEIGVADLWSGRSWSHPVWVRGLKLSVARYYLQKKVVAPRVGAWIETIMELPYYNPTLSHPVWVRGLKLMLKRC